MARPSRRELLGTGDGARPNQRFGSQSRRLTYVSAPRASGAASTLELRVDGVLWEQVATLFGLAPRSESYVIRRSRRRQADDQSATASGRSDRHRRRGRRDVPERDRLRAWSRRGADAPAKDAARHPWRDEPGPGGGAADPEALDAARTNAPLTVLTLERIVSLPTARTSPAPSPGSARRRPPRSGAATTASFT